MPELLVIVVILTVILVVLTLVAALWIAVAYLGWVSLLDYLIVFLGVGTLMALLILAANGTEAGAIVGGLGAAYFAVKGVAYLRAERSTSPDAAD